LLERLGEQYGLDITDDALDLGGSSCLNLLVDVDGIRCVARIYRPYVTAPRLESIQCVRRALTSGGVPCGEVVPTRDGEPWAVIEGRLVEVERFVDHDTKMDTWERLEMGLPWLGRLHTVLQAVNVAPEGRTPLFANHIEPYDVLDYVQRAAVRVRAWGPSPHELQIIEGAEELAQRVSAAEGDIVSSLPRQLAHGDYWDDNVFFQNDHLVLITDFDFMGERARIDDLALTLFFADSEFSRDPVSDERLRRLRVLVDAYDHGLESPLTREERIALPLALARQPLWWVGRWLALLDDEDLAREGLPRSAGDVEWALQLVREVERWQAAFT
jgi:homoserine kinase type II